jgi:hypothetical protein
MTVNSPARRNPQSISGEASVAQGVHFCPGWGVALSKCCKAMQLEVPSEVPRGAPLAETVGIGRSILTESGKNATAKENIVLSVNRVLSFNP